MKRLLLLLLFPSLCQAGEFKKVRDAEWEFSGLMGPADAARYKELFLEEKGRFKVTVDSEGGYLSAGADMAFVTYLMHERVDLVAKECYSAAAMWVSADPGHAFYDDKSLIAWHLAWMSYGGIPVEQSVGDTSRLAMMVWESMRLTLPKDKADTVFNSMCHARDKYGINGFVVFQKNKPRRVGLWKPDGWEWEDGSASVLPTRLDPFYIRPH